MEVSLEPGLPFEFLVAGTAISQQGSPRSRAAWARSVREAARDALPEGSWLLTEPLSVTIFIFPGAALQGDIDNRVKPILDAMIGCVYRDDEMIERLVVQKFEPGGGFVFPAATALLKTALSARAPLVYIRVTNDLHEDLAR